MTSELPRWAGRSPDAVVLDMSRAEPGEHAHEVGDSNVKLSRKGAPGAIDSIGSPFPFESRGTVTVPVEVQFTGEGLDGYTIATSQIDPPRLVIAGPRSHVAKITVAKTDPIDVSKATGTLHIPVNVFVNDAFVRFITAPEAMVTITMKKK